MEGEDGQGHRVAGGARRAMPSWGEAAGRVVRVGCPRYFHSKIIGLVETTKEDSKRLGDLITNSSFMNKFFHTN